MARWHMVWAGGALLGSVSVAMVAAAEAPLSPQEAAQIVVVTDLSVHNGIVSGTLVNKTGHVVRDVRLLIRHSWVWKDERHPGTDSPGMSEFYVVRTPIPSGQSVRFTQTPSPPLPRRNDGHFDASAEVVGFEEVSE